VVKVHLLTFSQLAHCSSKLKSLVSALTLDLAGVHIWTHCSMNSLKYHRGSKWF